MVMLALVSTNASMEIPSTDTDNMLDGCPGGFVVVPIDAGFTEKNCMD